MTRGTYVPLPEEEREALITLADREWRRPRDQASKLLSDALRSAGALPADDHVTEAGSPATTGVR